MLRHSKSAVSMTFVCLGIAKLECQTSLGIFFSLFYKPMHDMLKEKKNMQRKIKSKKIKNALKMIASVYSRRCGSYRMYLKGDSPHQIIMIVCELDDFLIFQIIITCIHLCNLAMFFTHNTQYSLLFLIHVQVQCDLSITRFYMY